MPDTSNDSTKSHDAAIDWAKKVKWSDAPLTDFNYFPQMRLSIPMPPVIGQTPEKRSHRWWKLLFHVVTRVHDRIARLVKQECFDKYICGEFYWVRNEWPWLETVEKKLEASRSKPIYDHTWKPEPITWGRTSFDEQERRRKELSDISKKWANWEDWKDTSLEYERRILMGDYTNEPPDVSDDPVGADTVPNQG